MTPSNLRSYAVEGSSPRLAPAPEGMPYGLYMPMSLAAPLLLALFLASALPWLLVFRARFGHLLAIPATGAGALVLLLGVLMLSHLVGANYIVAIVVACVVVGAVGALLAVRTPNVLRRPSRYSVVLWCGSLLGGVIWLATVGLAHILPGASRYGWAMNGDALNNLYYAGKIVTDNGIALGAQENPVPLPSAIIALALGAGSASSRSAEASLIHQLSAFTLVWVLLLTVTCVAMGVVVASLVKPTLTRTVAVASALGSLLPLTWFVSGLTIQWGYFNVSLLLPIALASWLVFLGSRAHPVAAFVILTGLATLALAAWTPIAFLVVALGVVIVVRNFGTFRSLRGWQLAVAAVGLVQAAGFVVFDSLPTLFAQDSSLATPGVGFPNLWWTGPIAVVLVVLTLIVVRVRTPLPVVSGAVGLLIGAAVASGAMLYFTHSHADPWDYYYPKKLVWTLVVLLAVVGLSFAIGSIAGRTRLRAVVAFGVLALFAAAVLPPGTWPEMAERQPVARITGDFVRHSGEDTVDDILRLSTTNHSHVLWLSGDPDEPIVNEWLLLADGGFVHGNKKLTLAVGQPYFLYRASGRYQDTHIETLCGMLRYMNAKSTVYTADPEVAGELAVTCPQYSPRVIVDTSFEGPPGTINSETWETDGIE